MACVCVCVECVDVVGLRQEIPSDQSQHYEESVVYFVLRILLSTSVQQSCGHCAGTDA